VAHKKLFVTCRFAVGDAQVFAPVFVDRLEMVPLAKGGDGL
jgi:hypothetical protein